MQIPKFCRWVLVSTMLLVGCGSQKNLAPLTYSLGGQVAGLTGSLQLQNAKDMLTLNAGVTTFQFAEELTDLTSYNVTITEQPTGQTCLIINGAGVVHGNVDNIVVACTSQVASVSTFSVSATVGHLAGTLILVNNNTDELVVGQDGSYTFPTPLADLSAYNVTVASNPPGQTCVVNQGTGVIVGSDMNNVQVVCQTAPVTYMLSVGVTGLNGTLMLANNGNDILQVIDNGTFAFANPLVSGEAYSVSLVNNPVNQWCAIQNNAGRINNYDISNVGVSCQNSMQYFTVSVQVSGLIGSLTLQNNGGDNLTIQNDGSYTFHTTLKLADSYHVTIQSAPASETCSLFQASGVIAGFDVTSVVVSCIPNS